MYKNTRWYYRSSDHGLITGLEELRMIGFHSQKNSYNLELHQHQDSYEFVYIEKGKSTWEIDGEDYATKAGDLIFTKPGVMHRGRHNIIEPCQMWWLQLYVPQLRNQEKLNWLQFSNEDAHILWNQFDYLPKVIHIRTGIAENFHKIRNALENRNALSVLKVRQYISNFLFTILDNETLFNIDQNDVDLLPILKAKMADDWTWRPSVNELAKHFGYSPSHFHKVFYNQLGSSPISYMERLRIEEASDMLLDTNDNITKIANLLGYATSQHFATSFLRYKGCSPSNWRKTHSSFNFAFK